MRRYALLDDQWERIKEGLPGSEGAVGVNAADNRLFVEAVLYLTVPVSPSVTFRSVGEWKNMHRRFRRWAESGVWERVFRCLAEDADNEYVA